VQGSATESAADAAYFTAWIDRLVAATKANHDWNNEAEKQSVLKLLDEARHVYVSLQK